MDRNLRIRMLFEGLDRATKPLRDIAGASGKTGQELSETRQRLQQLQTTSRDVGGFRRLKGEIAGTRTELTSARQRTSELGRQLAATSNPTRALTRDFDRAKREVSQLEQREREQVRTLGTLRERLRGAGVETRQLATHERRLRGDIADTTKALERQASRLERNANRRQRLGAARDKFGQMQDLTGRVAIGGAGGIASGIAIGAPITAAAREAVSFESAMADVRKVVDGLDDRREFQRMSDDILQLSTRLPMVPEQIAAIVAAGGQSGIAREQLLGFAEDATKMGVAFDITGDEAGAMMAKWRTAFGVGREGVTKLADQVNYLGNTTAANTGLISDIVTRIGPLGEVGGLASGQIAALGATIGGVGIESEIAATGIKNLMLGLTKGEAATKGQQAALKALGLDARNVAQSMQRDASGTILDVMQRLQRLPKDVQAGTLTKMFGSESVAAIAPLLTQLDTLRDNFGKVADAQQYAGSMEAEYASRAATSANALQLASNNATALKIVVGNQLLPVITAGAQRLGAIAMRVQAFAQRHPRLIKLVAFLAAGLAVLMIVLGGLGFVAAGLIAPFTLLAPIATAFGIGLLPVVGIAFAVIAAIVALATAAYFLITRWDAVRGFFGRVWAAIKTAFFTALSGIGARLLAFSPMGILIGGIAALLSWLGVRVPNQLVDVGRNLILGLIRGITGMLGQLKSTVVNAASSAANWFKQKLGIRSPSRVFIGYGGDMMDGLSAGIARGERAPIGRIDSLTRSLTAALAIGTATPSIAAMPGGGLPASGAPGAAAPAPIGDVHIHINGANRDAQDIATEVERILRKLQAGDRSAGRASFADRPDWED